MTYEKRYFDPAADKTQSAMDEHGNVSYLPAGGQPEDLYVYEPRMILALNLARATRRPLLISGEPGSGKSTLARNVAAVLGWRFYKKVVTSRTQASDLMYSFDALQRLNDAYTPGTELRSKQHYVEPDVLWWAFDPDSASHRGNSPLEERSQVKDPSPAAREHHAVVLIDEIDKADPDVPNDLLDPFDVKTFTVKETNDEIGLRQGREILLILTTNGERELPRAFMRRCLTLRLREPDPDWLVGIANRRYGEEGSKVHAKVAGEVEQLRSKAKAKDIRPPGTSEYLDALRICQDLRIDDENPVWSDVAQSVLWKSETPIPTE
jgi:MoxR-like ATPase